MLSNDIGLEVERKHLFQNGLWKRQFHQYTRRSSFYLLLMSSFPPFLRVSRLGMGITWKPPLCYKSTRNTQFSEISSLYCGFLAVVVYLERIPFPPACVQSIIQPVSQTSYLHGLLQLQSILFTVIFRRLSYNP